MRSVASHVLMKKTPTKPEDRYQRVTHCHHKSKASGFTLSRALKVFVHHISRFILIVGQSQACFFPVFRICANVTEATVCLYLNPYSEHFFPLLKTCRARRVQHRSPVTVVYGAELQGVLILLQGFVFLCTRPCPAGPRRFLLPPSPRPDPRTSTCPTWARATTERAQTSTAW